MRTPFLPLVFLLGAGAASCTTDSTLTKDLIGTWTWKPNQQLPADKVHKEGFVTPDVETVQLGADGRYVLVQQLPGYDTSVGGTTVHVPELWLECHGSWSVSKGEVSLEDSDGERWIARHEAKGWGSEPASLHRCAMYSYAIVTHEKHRLELKAIAIGDYDRTFEKSSATIPARPGLSAP